MKLRCREGDLALIIRDEPGCEANRGRVVTVHGPLHDTEERGPTWLIVPVQAAPAKASSSLPRKTCRSRRCSPSATTRCGWTSYDGHNTGLYTWAYLRELGAGYDAKWARYLERCAKLGYDRKPRAP